MKDTLIDEYISFKEERKKILLAQLSFYEFIKQSWPVIEGGIDFIDNWHIQAIAEHLSAYYRRDIKRLLINIPPRTSKSSIISVMFPVWVWLQNPQEEFIYSSYSRNLAMIHALKCKRLMESNWFCKRWGHYLKFAKDKKGTLHFDNNHGGSRKITSVGGSATGQGGSIIIADDPNSTGEYNSEARMQKAIEWWDSVWLTRLNNPKNDVMIVVQQRLHENDITGHILSNNKTASSWIKLILPMEYEESRKAKTIVLPFTNGKVWEDPRKEDGELLCENRFTAQFIEEKKHEMGSYLYAGQFQQRPAPEEGGIIRKSWFNWWKHDKPPEIQFIVQSWDTALTANEMSAYSACTTWGVFLYRNIEHLILLGMWRGKVEYPELREMAKRLYRDYRDTDKEHNPRFKGRQPDLCLIEAKASGDPLIQDMRKGGISAAAFNPNKYGDKIQRVKIITPIIEGGRVWLRAQSPKYDRLMAFSDDFLQEVATFPNGSSRDLVDTMTQALLKLRDSNFILNPRDERPQLQDYYNVKKVY